MSIYPHVYERKPRFESISFIVRNAAGLPIGRILRLLLEGQTAAYTYTGPQPIGRFNSERAAIMAIRARARRP